MYILTHTHTHTHTGPSQALKGLVVGMTLVTFGFLYQYYDAAISARRLAGVKLESGVTLNSLRGAGLLNSFVLDFAIMIPQPLPGLSRTITLKEESYDLDSLLVLSFACFTGMQTDKY